MQAACETAASYFFPACLHRGFCHGGNQLILGGLQVRCLLEVLKVIAGVFSWKMSSGWLGLRGGIGADLISVVLLEGEASAVPLHTTVVCSFRLPASG